MNHGTQHQLDNRLRPIGSPAAAQGSVVTGFNFANRYQRDAITTNKIKNFNFSQGQGGTLTLGGTNNGNGQMIVKNASGGTAVQVDNNGITVYNGDILIQNQSAVDIIDSSGIVSTSNFTINSILSPSGSVYSTTSTSPVDVPGGAFNSFVLSRSVQAAIFLSAWAYNIAWLASGDKGQVQIVDNLNGTLIGIPFYITSKLNSVSGAASPYTSFGYAIDPQWVSASVIVNLDAGTHNMKLQYYANSSGTANIELFQEGYVLYGS